MKVRPLADRVLVKTEKTESKTASGIIIPDTAQEKTQTAVVIAVGDDKEKIKVATGDRIMYDKYAGTSIKIDGVDHEFDTIPGVLEDVTNIILNLKQLRFKRQIFHTHSNQERQLYCRELQSRAQDRL